MANMSNAINMSFRVDKNLKKEADDIIYGKKESKAYQSVEKLIEDLEND